MQLLEKADERRGEGVIAQFAPVHPLVLGAPHGVRLEFGGVDGNVKYLVGEPVLKAESCRRKAPPPRVEHVSRQNLWGISPDASWL